MVRQVIFLQKEKNNSKKRNILRSLSYRKLPQNENPHQDKQDVLTLLIFKSFFLVVFFLWLYALVITKNERLIYARGAERTSLHRPRRKRGHRSKITRSLDREYIFGRRFVFMIEKKMESLQALNPESELSYRRGEEEFKIGVNCWLKDSGISVSPLLSNFFYSFGYASKSLPPSQVYT